MNFSKPGAYDFANVVDVDFDLIMKKKKNVYIGTTVIHFFVIIAYKLYNVYL